MAIMYLVLASLIACLNIVLLVFAWHEFEETELWEIIKDRWEKRKEE